MGNLSKRILGSVIAAALSFADKASACPLDLQSHPDPFSIRSIFDPIPTSGDQKLLILLVDFSDQPGQFTQSSFSNLYFTNPTESFSSYFKEVSRSNLNYSGDVVGISGGSSVVNGSGVSYVRLPNPKSYYANGNSGLSSDFPKNLGGIFYHALTTLEGVGFDFSPYADGNGEVQNVIVIFSGRSSVESRDAGDIQPTAYSLDVYMNGGYVSNGFTFKNFTICPEMNGSSQSGIGVCAHEHGHALGLPDLYDGSYVTFGVGYFDLMSFGTFGARNGARPFHLGAFPKLELGWATPTQNLGTPEIVTLEPSQNSGAIYKLTPSETSKEYFLLENRQAMGFDDEISDVELCPGLLIWHIDEEVYDANRQANKVNVHSSAGGPSHPGVALVEQDGEDNIRNPGGTLGECDDTFAVGTSWGKSSDAAHSKLWDGTATNFSLEVLEVSSTGALTIALNGAEVPVSSITAKAKKRTVSGSITKPGAKAGYMVSLVRVKGGKTVKRARTKASGKFSFKNVSPGRYIAKCEDKSSRPVKVKKVF